MSDVKPSLFRHRLELLILTESEEAFQRAKQITSARSLTFKRLSFDIALSDKTWELQRAILVLLAQEKGESLQSFSQRVTLALQKFPRSRFVTVMAEGVSGAAMFGAHDPRVTALSPAEFYTTLKFEYLCVYRCRSQYYEVQLNDFFPMTTMLVPCYVRLPLNQCYLPVIQANATLVESRVGRLENFKQVFIRITDSPKYYEYINSYYDSNGAALKKKVRALFLALYYYSLALNENILFDLKSSSEAHIEAAYGGLQTAAQALLEMMKSTEDLWDVIREAHDSEIGELWRAPWIAVYAALISVKTGLGDPMVTLVSGLLMDVGIFDLDDETARTYLFSENKSLEDRLMSSFEKHPVLSLNRALIKKVPINESIKSVIVCTHENAHETGFPNQVPADKLPLEAQLLMFAEGIDQEVQTTMKKNSTGFRFLKEKFWESEKNSGKNFSETFLTSIAEALL